MADTKRCPVTGRQEIWPYVWRCTQTADKEISLAAAQSLGINDWHKHSHPTHVLICEEHFNYALQAGCIDRQGNLPT